MVEKPPRFTKDSTQKGPEGGRGLEIYEKALGFKRKELEGKTVLDLGSGILEKFSRELAAEKIDANVVSLNPDYIAEEYRKRIKQLPDWQKMSVAGLGEELPFKNGSFDFVFALSSITDWAHDPAKICAEIVRVLKDGGSAHIGPIDLYPPTVEGDEDPDVTGMILSALKANGVKNIQVEPNELGRGRGFIKATKEVPEQNV